MYRYYLVLIFILNPIICFAVPVSQDVSPTYNTVGSPITYTLIWPKGHEIVLSETWGPFEKVALKQVGNQQQYQLTVYKTGDLVIPTQTASVYYQGKKSTQSVPPVKVTIRSVLTSDVETSLESYVPFLWVYPRTYHVIWLWGAGLSLLGILIYAYLYYKKNRRAHLVNIRTMTHIDPHKKAEKELKKLGYEQHIEKGRYIAYYATVSLVLKQFLTEKVSRNIIELTSEETRMCLQDLGVDIQTIRRIQGVLFACDNVKFAKKQVAKEDACATLDKVTDILRRMKDYKQ